MNAVIFPTGASFSGGRFDSFRLLGPCDVVAALACGLKRIRRHLDIFVLFANLFGGIAVLGCSPPAEAEGLTAKTTEKAEAVRTVWAGIYTEEQKLRGESAYLANCASCHNTTLRGSPGGPSIAGGRFTLKWVQRSVGEFLAYTQQNMPVGQGWSLTAASYADIVAYILNVNGYPAGESELPSDAKLLESVLIIAD